MHGPKVIRRPAGWPVDRFSAIQPVWRADTVVCIGGGPSVTQGAVDSVRGRARVIAVNNAYWLAPWADMLYFADGRWWEWHKDDPRYQAFAGQRVTIEGTGLNVADPDVHFLHNYSTTTGDQGGLSETPNGLRTGSNGGYQAVNIATLAGTRRILLLGYDMRFVNGRSHWHGGHPAKVPESHYSVNYARYYASMLPHLERLGVAVINCTPGSKLTAFPFLPLEDALPCTS